MSTHLQEQPISLDPSTCWTVLERVAAIPSLRRAARLREFLLYVGAKSLKEGRTDIHEQEIGETVFARPHAYDTSQDNIVRVSATELRKRIDAYFTNEGGTEAILFEIPRGSYLPVFRQREIALVAEPEVTGGQPVVESASAAPAVQQNRAMLWTVSALALILAILCMLLYQQNTALRNRIQQLEHPQSSAQ